MSRSFRDAIAAEFRTHPGCWIDGLDLARIGGAYASRTRISECRQQLGMVIENRVRTLPSGTRRSEYRYVPALVPVQADLLEARA